MAVIRLSPCVFLSLSLILSAAPLPAAGLDPRKAVTQYNLDAWTTASGLPQNTVTAIAQTRDGYLWMGSFGGLARFDGARFVVFDKSTTPALRNSGVHALLADRSGGLWVGTNGGGNVLDVFSDLASLVGGEQPGGEQEQSRKKQ